jgi:hypothetical protein
MRPAEVVVTSRRPTLTSEWLDPMPRRERASNRNHQPRSRVEEWEKLGRELAEHKKAGEALRERAQALARRDPNDPNDKPENDTYVRIDDLVEGAPITGPAAAARPPLTVWWSEDMVPEFIALQLRALHHFAQQGLYNPKTRRFCTKKGVIKEFFKGRQLSNGSKIGDRKANFLAMFCLPVDRLDGGPVPEDDEE